MLTSPSQRIFQCSNTESLAGRRAQPKGWTRSDCYYHADATAHTQRVRPQNSGRGRRTRESLRQSSTLEFRKQTAGRSGLVFVFLPTRQEGWLCADTQVAMLSFQSSGHTAAACQWLAEYLRNGVTLPCCPPTEGTTNGTILLQGHHDVGGGLRRKSPQFQSHCSGHPKLCYVETSTN